MIKKVTVVFNNCWDCPQCGETSRDYVCRLAEDVERSIECGYKISKVVNAYGSEFPDWCPLEEGNILTR